MMIVNRKNDRISGALEGKPFNILFDEGKFTQLKELGNLLDRATNKLDYESILAKINGLLVVNFNEEVAAANGFLKYNINKKSYHLVVNKGLPNEKVSKDAIPKVLADRIIESYEEGNDFMPLLLAWRRFLVRENTNPEDQNLFANYLTSLHVDQTTVEKLLKEGLDEGVAVELSTFNDIAITTFGILATYKVVDRVNEIYKLTKDDKGKTVKEKVEAFPGTEEVDEVTGEITKTPGKCKYLEELTFTPAIHKDGDKFFSGDKLGYKYKIGEEAVLPSEAVRNLDNTFGGGGLYAGGLRYIDGYSNDSRDILTCLIDPSEIISFQSDGAALRVNRMFINGITTEEGELKSMYFVSDYAKESTERMKQRFTEAIALQDKAIEATLGEVDLNSGIIADIENV